MTCSWPAVCGRDDSVLLGRSLKRTIQHLQGLLAMWALGEASAMQQSDHVGPPCYEEAQANSVDRDAHPATSCSRHPRHPRERAGHVSEGSIWNIPPCQAFRWSLSCHLRAAMRLQERANTQAQPTYIPMKDSNFPSESVSFVTLCYVATDHCRTPRCRTGWPWRELSMSLSGQSLQLKCENTQDFHLFTWNLVLRMVLRTKSFHSGSWLLEHFENSRNHALENTRTPPLFLLWSCGSVLPGHQITHWMCPGQGWGGALAATCIQGRST